MAENVSEYPSGDSGYNVQVLQQLRDNFVVANQPYDNYLVDVEQDNFTNQYDPGFLGLMTTAMFLWPGGNPETGNRLETIIHAPGGGSGFENAEKVQQTRAAVLHASIGAATLERVHPETKENWEECKRKHQVPILYATNISALLGLPLAVMQISQVSRINMQVPSPDTRIAHLWAPAYLSPKPVLFALKKALRELIAEEQP